MKTQQIDRAMAIARSQYPDEQSGYIYQAAQILRGLDQDEGPRAVMNKNGTWTFVDQDGSRYRVTVHSCTCDKYRLHAPHAPDGYNAYRCAHMFVVILLLIINTRNSHE